MAGNTAAFVIDQSLIRQPSAVALSGPMPAEASEDAQSFYYYYEEAADDTQVSCLFADYTCSGTQLACTQRRLLQCQRCLSVHLNTCFWSYVVALGSTLASGYKIATGSSTLRMSR